jgi:hypothetical protein
MSKENDEERDLRAALLLILDHVDYTTGACRPNEPVGGILPTTIIELARRALAIPATTAAEVLADGLHRIVDRAIERGVRVVTLPQMERELARREERAPWRLEWKPLASAGAELSDEEIRAWWHWADTFDEAAPDMLHARGLASATAPDGPTPEQVNESRRRIAAALAARRPNRTTPKESDMSVDRVNEPRESIKALLVEPGDQLIGDAPRDGHPDDHTFTVLVASGERGIRLERDAKSALSRFGGCTFGAPEIAGGPGDGWILTLHVTTGESKAP